MQIAFTLTALKSLQVAFAFLFRIVRSAAILMEYDFEPFANYAVASVFKMILTD